MSSRLRGLYAITPEDRGERELVELAAAALRGGARMIQYRDKRGDAVRRLDEARQLRALCDTAGALLIVNDDPELAAEAGADGVHLGLDDTTIEAARIMLGACAIIGASCYDSLERAQDAAARGADYIAFGSFFPSPSKPGAERAPLELLADAKARLDIPLCAIGGITPDNGAQLVDAGADMLAVISGLFDTADVEATARHYSDLFRRKEP